MKALDPLRKALEKHGPLAEVSFSNLMPHLLRVAEAAEDFCESPPDAQSLNENAKNLHAALTALKEAAKGSAK